MSNPQQPHNDLNPPVIAGLTPGVIERAYEIANFVESGHPQAATLDVESRRLINDILAQYPPPERFQKNQRHQRSTST